MSIIKYRKIFYIFSGLAVGASLAALLIFGLRPGIDFAGGTILEVEFVKERPAYEQIRGSLDEVGFQDARLQPTEERGLIIRAKNLDEESHQLLLRALSGDKLLTEVLIEKRFDSIGPSIGEGLRRKAFVAIGLVILLILIFVTWAFRHVSKPVASWKYGIVAIAALMHDIVIPAGLFAYLGWLMGVEADSLFVTALLTILGFSVHDTIVVFDRIRENLKKADKSIDFETIVGFSLNETYGRSLATSFALFLVLAALFWFGPEATRFFALTLLIGVIAGTYSSICLASPFLVSWQKWNLKRGLVLTNKIL